jgi:Haem-binding domain
MKVLVKKILKKLVIILVIIFVGIQFVPTDRNESSEILKTDFIEVFNPPEEIKSILKISCYDCHSNNTIYPWYNKIQPISYLLESHIDEAKEELNFSEFGSYSKRKQKSKIKSLIKQVKKKEMPLPSYTLMHWDAVLSDDQILEFTDWIYQLKPNNIK